MFEETHLTTTEETLALISDFDIIYISYDEPNAEDNFLHLKNLLPHAKRVHGITGFDAAHREAGRIASTDHVFIVDGDNRITHDFLSEDVQIIHPNYIYSWSGKNVINGLIYGNGGIKLWPKTTLESVSCHDKDGNSIDWCFTVPYFQMNNWFSYTHCNASPYQAFRTGFREGVKLCLDSEGNRTLLKNGGIAGIAPGNRSRLIAWMTLGADVPNGIYSMFAARLGVLKILCDEDFDLKLISNYEWIKNYWEQEFSYVRNGYYQVHFDQMAIELRKLTGYPIVNYNSEQSKCAKEFYMNPSRFGLMDPKLADEEALVKYNYENKNSKTHSAVTSKKIISTDTQRKLYSEQDCRSFFRLIRSLFQSDFDLRILAALYKEYYRMETFEFGNVIQHLYDHPDLPLSPLSDSVSQGQIESKLWLVDVLRAVLPLNPSSKINVILMGGWYGILNLILMWRMGNFIEKVVSIDKDPAVKSISISVNQQYALYENRFFSYTEDMYNINFNNSRNLQNTSKCENFDFPADVIINTSCEHLDNFKKWFNGLPVNKVIVLQSNDFSSSPDHVNCAKSLNEFLDMTNFKTVLFQGTLQLQKYNRYMLVGIK